MPRISDSFTVTVPAVVREVTLDDLLTRLDGWIRHAVPGDLHNTLCDAATAIRLLRTQAEGAPAHAS